VPANEPTFHYKIAMPEPNRHLFDVTFTVTGPLPDTVDVCMPVWSPGSYLIREYARNVQDVEVRSPGGKRLEAEKISKHTWRIERAGGGFELAFKLYANELSVQAAHLDHTHGFIHTPAVCPYVDGYLASACEVTIVPFERWRVATGLRPVRGSANTFFAEDYDELADCPIECGDFAQASFTAGGRRHHIVVSGGGAFDLKELTRDTKRIVEAELEFWGGAPYQDYTFICHVYPNARGGLEHRNSTVLGIGSFRFHPRKEYEEQVLSLIAHEFFHTWNVKRIRPATLGPFDYSRENYTRLLWVFEGITSYYDHLFVLRAGLMTPKSYLKVLAGQISTLERTPGRLHQSLAESSFDTWIKLYRQNEHSPNSGVSYYLKGELVAFLLDLHLREKTDGKVSLDDVMRELWRRHGEDPRGIEEDEFERVAAEVSGLDLTRFFQRAVHSTRELDFDAALRPFGLQLAKKRKGEQGEEAEGATPWIGVETETKEGLVAIKHVYEKSPAALAGLDAGDLLLALDGYRIAPDSFKKRLRGMEPGREVEVSLFRRDRLENVSLKLGKQYELEYTIEPVAGAGKRQVQLRNKWLGTPLEEKGAKGRGSRDRAETASASPTPGT
jgi:predicted metalloprotease with PDZ domain